MTLLPFKLRTRSLSPTCLNLLLLTPTLPPLTLHVILRRRLTLILVLELNPLFAFVGAPGPREGAGATRGWGNLEDLVACADLRCAPAYKVCFFLSLRYQASAFSEISKPKLD